MARSVDVDGGGAHVDGGGGDGRGGGGSRSGGEQALMQLGLEGSGATDAAEATDEPGSPEVSEGQ